MTRGNSNVRTNQTVPELKRSFHKKLNFTSNEHLYSGNYSGDSYGRDITICILHSKHGKNIVRRVYHKRSGIHKRFEYKSIAQHLSKMFGMGRI